MSEDIELLTRLFQLYLPCEYAADAVWCELVAEFRIIHTCHSQAGNICAMHAAQLDEICTQTWMRGEEIACGRCGAALEYTLVAL